MPSFVSRASTLLAFFFWLSKLTISLCEPNPLVLDFVASPKASRNNNRLSKRNPLAVNLVGQGYVFYVNASIGTPPQPAQFIVDTNSADLLALSSTFSGCSAPFADCKGRGTYDAKSSSSYAYLNSNFTTAFGDGSSVTGDYAKDEFRIAGATVSKLQFGIAEKGNLTDNILGIGYIGLESKPSSYANLPTRMFNDGRINVIGYSLWFNHANTTTGRLLLGGVDTNKFIGTLETIPISMQQLQYDYVTIQLDGISISTGSTTTNVTNSRFRVIADSGTSSFIFPQAVVDQIGNLTNAKTDEAGYLIKEYTALNNDTTFNFRFGGTIISVPLTDLVIPYNATFAWLNVAQSPDDSLNILGVPFFRNAYLVFDYSHNQISMANIYRQDVSHNVSAIGQNGVAGLTGVSLESPPSSGGLSTGAKVGIGVGVSLGVLLLIGIGALVFFLRRKRRNASQEPTPVSGKTEDSTSPGFGKAELPAANEKKVDELDGAPAKPPTSEMSTENQNTRAELYPSVLQGKSFAPQELPGDMPQPKEMETEFNSPDGAISDMTSGASQGRETATDTGTSKSLLSSRQ